RKGALRRRHRRVELRLAGVARLAEPRPGRRVGHRERHTLARHRDTVDEMAERLPGEGGNGPQGDLPTIRLHGHSAIDYRVKYIARSTASNPKRRLTLIMLNFRRRA